MGRAGSQKALALNPQYSEAHNNLGEALAGKGAVKEAIAQFEAAVELDPAYAVARTNLGIVLAHAGQTNKAIFQLKRVVEAKPDAVDARINLAQALAGKGRFDEASLHLEQAVRLSGGKNPLILHLLGHVYADLDRLPEALQSERQALAIATAQDNPKLIQDISAQLEKLLQAQQRSAGLPSR